MMMMFLGDVKKRRTPLWVYFPLFTFSAVSLALAFGFIVLLLLKMWNISSVPRVIQGGTEPPLAAP